MDRQRAVIAGAVTAAVLVVVLAIGFVVGRASVDDDSSTGTEPGASTDSDGLPAGPARMEDGVPVGFAHSEDGAMSAALSWVPWLISSPASERPARLGATRCSDR